MTSLKESVDHTGQENVWFVRCSTNARATPASGEGDNYDEWTKPLVLHYIRPPKMFWRFKFQRLLVRSYKNKRELCFSSSSPFSSWHMNRISDPDFILQLKWKIQNRLCLPVYRLLLENKLEIWPFSFDWGLEIGTHTSFSSFSCYFMHMFSTSSNVLNILFFPTCQMFDLLFTSRTWLETVSVL